MTETITITRALAELKLLDKKIKDEIYDQPLFIACKSKKQKQSHFNFEAFTTEAKATYQSINDLISRRNKIKSAIIMSNANTTVKIGNLTLTVAEVIERKHILVYKTELRNVLKAQRESVRSQVEKNNQLVDTELQSLLATSFGKSTNGKINVEDIENISKTYRDNNESIIVDPINIDLRIKELDTEIELLEKEANFVLSESNAITYITI
jgi:hypothetical protein